MSPNGSGRTSLDPEARAFYCAALTTLLETGVPFLVGGAYALRWYTGIERYTQDFDVFTRREDCGRILQVLASAGWQTELTYPHWLAKAFCGQEVLDIIFSSGNGSADVNDEWFEHAVEAEILGLPLKLCPVEEMLWQKAYIMERERFDGADVAHLIRACAEKLNWARLMRRFGSGWRVLLSHLILFGFIYPGERDLIPAWVVRQLLRCLDRELSEASHNERVCQGTLLSRAQYLGDLDHWGYLHARLLPRGSLTTEQTERWTAAIEEEL